MNIDEKLDSTGDYFINVIDTKEVYMTQKPKIKKYKKCNGCGSEYPSCGCLGGGPENYYRWVDR